METAWLKMIALVVPLAFAIGCSGGVSEPVAPEYIPASTQKIPAERKTESERMLLGMWTIEAESGEFTPVPVPLRVLQAHYNITAMVLPPSCDDCFELQVISFDPVTRIMEADITLRNKFGVVGRDLRGIVFTNDYGHMLTNPDDWTKLWETPGGQDINPFIAFAKEVPNRVFGGTAEHTETFLIYIPQPPHYEAIAFAIDISWPGNCKEPYSIENFVQVSPLYETVGSSCELRVDVLDWQDDVNSVMFKPQGLPGMPFTHLSGNTWSLNLINSIGVPGGRLPDTHHREVGELGRHRALRFRNPYNQ